MIQEIDGATVICHTEPNKFGYVEFENGERQQIRVLAICKYNKEEFYVFACDDEFNVLGDTVHTNYDEAMKFATEYYDHEETIWINA